MGPANANYKHGKWSKFLPKKLLATYRRMEADIDLASLHSELAVIDAHLGELFGQLDNR